MLPYSNLNEGCPLPHQLIEHCHLLLPVTNLLDLPQITRQLDPEILVKPDIHIHLYRLIKWDHHKQWVIFDNEHIPIPSPHLLLTLNIHLNPVIPTCEEWSLKLDLEDIHQNIKVNHLDHIHPLNPSDHNIQAHNQVKSSIIHLLVQQTRTLVHHHNLVVLYNLNDIRPEQVHPVDHSMRVPNQVKSSDHLVNNVLHQDGTHLNVYHLALHLIRSTVKSQLISDDNHLMDQLRGYTVKAEEVQDLYRQCTRVEEEGVDHHKDIMDLNRDRYSMGIHLDKEDLRLQE
ncbi:MAG: hypothetical protein L6R35_007505 [Caloplaca aegaea]|nr:MAG: hypothetical protein L6R35_007505 [Caloplaca aegaea]